MDGPPLGYRLAARNTIAQRFPPLNRVDQQAQAVTLPSTNADPTIPTRKKPERRKTGAFEVEERVG